MMALRVLVIDDDDQVRGMLCEMLKNAGYEAMDADNGRTGLNQLRQAPCDILITDIFMPEKEGIETIIEARREFPHLKILAVSGGSPLMPTDFLATAKIVGAHMTLQKPILQRELLDALDRMCGSSSSRLEGAR